MSTSELNSDHVFEVILQLAQGVKRIIQRHKLDCLYTGKEGFICEHALVAVVEERREVKLLATDVNHSLGKRVF